MYLNWVLITTTIIIITVSTNNAQEIDRTSIVENVGSLQQDFIHPVLFVSVGVFTVLSIIDLLLTFLTGVADTRGTIKGNTISIFQKVFMFLFANGIIDHFIELAVPSQNPILSRIDAATKPAKDNARRRRAVDEVTNTVMAAINKYNSLQN
jgi:hypothetical protein